MVARLERVQKVFNDMQAEKGTGKQVSLADLIVLGGCAAVEQAAKQAGVPVWVSLKAGRTDATQDTTDAKSFAVLAALPCGARFGIASPA